MKRFRPIDKPLHGQRGSVLIWFALLLPILLGFMALAIDLSRIYLAKVELQNAADAAALAGSYKYAHTTSLSAAETEARNLASSNYANGAPIDAASVTTTIASVPGYSSPIQVTILLSGMSLFLAPILGVYSTDVSATATAVQSPTISSHFILVSK